MRRFALVLLAVCSLAPGGTAAGAGGNYAFAGGTAREQAQVTSALDASAFDWNLVPARITIHIAPGGPSEATPGDVWLDASLLDAGVFSWGTVQHEYAHQVDFFLLDDAKRTYLQTQLGGRDWCYSVSGLVHADHGCERFASTLVWAYWQNAANTMQPRSSQDESAAMAPAAFRALLTSLIGAPAVAPAKTVTAYAPIALRHPARPHHRVQQVVRRRK
jgi:hypothetical protein